MATTFLTAGSVETMHDSALVEAYVECFLRGEEESDFALAAKRDLIEGRLYAERDLDEEIGRALDERAADLMETKMLEALARGEDW